MMDMLDSNWDCESYTETETSDSEDHDDTESAYGGHAQSILSSLDESIGKIDDFLAIERGFVHGDIVCSVTDPSGQMGRVVDVNMVADLESTCGEIIKDVNCKKLLKVRSFAVGDYVVHGPWLGRVVRVYDLITILFDDGAKCEILTGDTENIFPVSSKPLEDVPCPYYPGQRVQISNSTIFRSARWLCGMWKASRDVGTVFHAEVGSVGVDWIASAPVGRGILSSTPPCVHDPTKLTLLSCYPYANWQLGDWCKLPLDYSQNLQMPAKEQVPLSIPHQHLIEMQKLRVNNHGFEQIYVIVKTKTKVDVLWQDGKLSSGLDLNTLFPVQNVGDHDFWPEQFVLEKPATEDAQVSTGKRLGIVKNVDALERTVRVKWVVLEFYQVNGSGGEYSEETLSAYELIEHSDYSYCLGDVVFRLPQTENLEETPLAIHTSAQGKRYKNISPKGMDFNSVELLERDKKINFDGHDDYALGYLSSIGNVIGFKDGGIEVRWASGLTSKVKPSEIFGIDRSDYSASTSIFNEDAIDGNISKEVAEQDSESWKKQEKDVLKMTENISGDDCGKNLWEVSAHFIPRVAIGFLTSVACSLFCYPVSNPISFTMSSGYINRFNRSSDPNLETPALITANRFDHWRSMSGLQVLRTEDGLFEVKNTQVPCQISLEQEVEMNEPPTVLAGGEKTVQFQNFDIVNDYSDHHFVDGVGKGLVSSQVKRGWMKKVQHEWSMLKKDLPDTIYVRVYEERMDLLRASLVGAPGTPYHDALFFFDICFPPDYPHEPPLVHYNSGGLRLNPNLYESGKICLSLLNTWTGTGTEVWNPESSTILQVLVSLQALVLNEKPYFNEAGYDKQTGRADGERNSMTYNENAFLLSCKSMLYVLHNSPKHFETLVEEHFTCRAHHILLACKAYMDGAQVGRAFGYGNVASETTHKSSSTGFKITLAKLFLKLLSGFAEKGIDCSQFVENANKVLEKA